METDNPESPPSEEVSIPEIITTLGDDGKDFLPEKTYIEESSYLPFVVTDRKRASDRPLFENKETGMLFYPRTSGLKETYPILVMRNDKLDKSFERSVIDTDLGIKLSYIVSDLYEKIGIEIPKTYLIEDPPILLAEWKEQLSDPKTGILTDNQKDDIKRIYISSIALGDTNATLDIKKDNSGKMFLKGVFIKTDSDKVPSNSNLIYNDRYFNQMQEKVGVILDPNGKVEKEMMEKISSITPKEIVRTVLKAKLTNSQTRDVVDRLLEHREFMINKLKPENLENSLVNTQEWDKLDQIIERSSGNEKYHDVSTHCSEFCKSVPLITKISKNLEAFEINQYDGERVKGKNPLNIKKIDSEIARQSKELKMDFNSMLEASEFLYSAGELILDKKNQLPRLIYNLRGYRDIERNLNSLSLYIQSTLRHKITNEISEIYNKFKVCPFHQEHKKDQLEYYLSPTKNQLIEINNFINVIKEPNIANRLSNNTDFNPYIIRFKDRRFKFKKLCESLSKSPVSHLSVPTGIRQILKTGFLKSSMKQSEDGDKVIGNSPSFGSGFLPELVFSLDNAITHYGGDDKIPQKYNKDGKEILNFNRGYLVQPECSVGFVSYLPELVGPNSNRKFVNYGGEGIETHIFHINNSDSKRIGVEIPVDSCSLLVPKEQKEYWINYVLKECNKTEDWAERHIRTYPPFISIGTYVKHFMKRNGDLGVFISNENEMRVDNISNKMMPFTFEKLNPEN